MVDRCREDFNDYLEGSVCLFIINMYEKFV